MKNKYYSEKKIKNSRYRVEYAESIAAFLKENNELFKEKRRMRASPKELRRDPDKYRSLFTEMLGFPLTTMKAVPVLKQKLFVAEDGNVEIYRMQFEIDGILFYGLYFHQKERFQDKPFVIGLHGGEGTPETVGSIYDNSTNYNHLVRRLTDRGCSVFCPQLLLWNKETYGADYNRTDVDSKLRMMGGSVTALEVYLISCALDYFVECGGVNKERLGVAGLSYGGQFALDLAAFDERLKVCVSQGFFNDRFVYSESDWANSHALSYITDAEKAGLVCPRALCIAIGNKDYLFNSDYALEEGEYAKAFFEECDIPEKYDFYVFEGSHEADKSDRWIDFLMNNV